LGRGDLNGLKAFVVMVTGLNDLRFFDWTGGCCDLRTGDGLGLTMTFFGVDVLVIADLDGFMAVVVIVMGLYGVTFFDSTGCWGLGDGDGLTTVLFGGGVVVCAGMKLN